MNKKVIKIAIILAVIALVAGFFIGKYNTLVDLESNVEQKLADIDVQLQRRNDLIPNLVNTVKGYMKHEQEALNKVTTAREKLNSVNSAKDKADASEELRQAVNNLLVLVENYPDLKADAQFTQLQDELAGTENRIAVARKDYNSVVTDFNKKIKVFPNNLISSIFGFEKAEYFEASKSSAGVPNVEIE